MLVRAKEVGFIYGERKRVGDVFEFNGAKLAKWMELVEEAPAKAEGKKVKPAPATVQKVDPKLASAKTAATEGDLA